MTTYLAVLIGVYIATCFFCHQSMLALYKNDSDPELNKVPKWFVHTGLFLGALFWPVVAAIAYVMKKKEK